MDGWLAVGFTTIGAAFFFLPAVSLYATLSFSTRMSLSTLQQALHLDSAFVSVGLLFAVSLLLHLIPLFIWTLLASAAAAVVAIVDGWPAAEALWSSCLKDYPSAIGLTGVADDFLSFLRIAAYSVVIIGFSVLMSLMMTACAHSANADRGIGRTLSKILYGAYADLLRGDGRRFLVIAAVQTIAPSAREVDGSTARPIFYYGVVEDLSVGRGDETRRLVLRRPLKLVIDQTKFTDTTTVVDQRPVIAEDLDPIIVIEGREIANIAFHRLDLASDRGA